jgi:hypothetical protein
MNYKALLICLGFILFTSIAISLKTTTAFAQSDEITYERVNPNQTFQFTIKRATEKFQMIFLTFFNKKGIGPYTAKLVSRRAAELVYIVENKKSVYLETSVSRFITYVGFLSEYLDSGNVSKEQVLEAIGNNKEEFERLRDMYPSQTFSWILLQQAADTADVLSSKARG